MSTYLETIYKTNKDSTLYDSRLCKYLVDRFDLKEWLLDFGCGTGSHVKFFSKYVHSVGIDMPEYNFEKDKIKLNANSFNTVFSKSVIEHIYKPDIMVKEMHRLLDVGGQVIIMTPDWNSQMSHFWDDYTHVHPYTPKSLKDLLIIHGFKDVHVELFYQIPFTWKYPLLKFIPKIISLLPQCLKWKTKEMRNGEDRKLIRFSKEKMILAWGTK